MTFRHGLLAATMVLVWAFNSIFFKVGTNNFPPLMFNGMRLFLGGLCFAWFYRPPAWSYKKIALLSFTMGTLQTGLIFIGFSMTDAGLAIVVAQMGAPFAVILAFIFFKERPLKPEIVGLALTIAGIVCLSGEPELPDFTPILFCLLGAFAFAVSSLIMKRLSGVTPLAVSSWSALLAGPQLFLLSYFIEQNHLDFFATSSAMSYFAIFFTGVIGFMVGQTIWCFLLGRYRLSAIGYLPLCFPVLTLLLAIPFLGETLSVYKVTGCIFVLGGVAIIQKYQFKKKDIP